MRWSARSAARSSRSHCSSPTSRPSWPSPGCTWKTCTSSPSIAAAASGARCSSTWRALAVRARLRPLRMERARLERARDPLLQGHGRHRDARVAHLPRHRRRAAESFRPEVQRLGARPRPLRRDYTGLPLARARALQHRRGVLRALGARRRPTRWRSAASTKTARACAFSYGRAAARGEPARATLLRALGVQRGDRVAIVMPQRYRDRGRAHGGVPARRGGDAAVDAVRPRRARVPAAATARPAARSSTRAASPTCWPRGRSARRWRT